MNKVVAIRKNGRRGTAFTAVAEFENGLAAVEEVKEYTDYLRETHRYIPWAKDFELVVTGRTSNVQFPKGVEKNVITNRAVERATGRSVRGDTA